MSEKLKFTVLTAVYNRPDVIGRCIESVKRAYDYAMHDDDVNIELEHIIVDDGSTDNTLSTINDYDYPFLKIIPLPTNKGNNTARNAGIKQAEGDYLIFLDSDDFITDDAICVIAKQIITNSDYSHYLFAVDDMVSYYKSNPKLNGSTANDLSFRDFLSGDVAGDFAHVVSRNIAQKFPFDENLRIYEHIGVLKYIREAKNVLFNNAIISIRERERADAATREAIRFNKIAIAQRVTSLYSQLSIFGNDYEKLGLKHIKDALQLSLAENLILLNRYREANDIIKEISVGSCKMDILTLIASLKAGSIYRLALISYLKAKYKLKS